MKTMRNTWSRPHYEICPSGFHNFKILQARLRVSKKGNAYWLLTCDVLHTNHLHVWEHILIDPKPPLPAKAITFLRHRLDRFVKAVGVTKDADIDALAGKLFTADIIHLPNNLDTAKMAAKVREAEFYAYARMDYGERDNE